MMRIDQFYTLTVFQSLPIMAQMAIFCIDNVLCAVSQSVSVLLVITGMEY